MGEIIIFIIAVCILFAVAFLTTMSGPKETTVKEPKGVSYEFLFDNDYKERLMLDTNPVLNRNPMPKGYNPTLEEKEEIIKVYEETLDSGFAKCFDRMIEIYGDGSSTQMQLNLSRWRKDLTNKGIHIKGGN